MHIATIAQTAHRPENLGWTHPAIPGKTLVRAADGLFYVEASDGSRELVSGGPAASIVRTLRDGWEPVPSAA